MCHWSVDEKNSLETSSLFIQYILELLSLAQENIIHNFILDICSQTLHVHMSLTWFLGSTVARTPYATYYIESDSSRSIF